MIGYLRNEIHRHASKSHFRNRSVIVTLKHGCCNRDSPLMMRNLEITFGGLPLNLISRFLMSNVPWLVTSEFFAFLDAFRLTFIRV